MAGDRHQPSPPKHRRNSGYESEEASKRHKHRHRHHRRHRHRSNRNHEDDVRTKDVVEEKVQTPPPQPLPLLVPSSKGNWRSDHDVEEGEILEEDDDLVGVKKKVDSSDAESGEIKVAVANANHKMEAVQVELDASTVSYGGQNVEKVGCDSTISGVDKDAVSFSTSAAISIRGIINGDAKTPDEIDLQTSSSVEHNADVDISNVNTGKSLRSSSPEGLEKRKEYYIGESEVIGQNPLFDVNEANKHISVGSSVLPEISLEEVRSINRSRSSYQAKERSRSQSRSNFEDASPLQAQQLKDLKSTEIRHPKDFDDEIIIRYHNDYQHDSRNLDKGRERSFSYSRHTTRDDRYHSSDTRNRVRDKSRETWDRDRKRERDWEKVQERAREGDRNREKDREKERERKREKERERRERDKEILKDKDCDKFTPNHKYNDADGSYGDRGRHTDYRHRLLDETEDKDKARRNNTNKAQSSRIDHSERDAQKQRRDELEQENYQESIVLQFEDKEEEEIEKIKKESRKRRQAILDKFKTQQSQKKLEPESEIDEKPSLSVAETHGVQYKVTERTLVETSSSVGKSPEQIVPPAIKTHVSGALGEGTPKSEGSADMFHDDIFGDSPAGVRKPEKGDGLIIERSGLNDNWDDAEGYYSYRFGEILDGRYEVIAAHGKGVFSSVVRAKDLKAGYRDPEEVAIKIIRSNDTMYKTGLEELVILNKLVGADQEDKRHCVRFISSFKYRNHLCLVFESLHMNLREVLKKFGRNIGLKLTAVRTYAKQLLIALKHLRNCSVLHCDIKPDNMLVNDAKNVLKLCDFGNAMFAGKNEVTPYLVSRFYRAPEIILGLSYDHPMDIWSVGCCLYEIYTGKVLFPGPSNNDMLRLHMELKGPFPKKMLRKGAFVDGHFDQDLNFLAIEEDPVTKKVIKRLVLNIKPKDIGSIVLGSACDDPKMLSNFKDLLEKIFVLDPDKRITVSHALSHPFITAMDRVRYLVEVCREDGVRLRELFLGGSFQ